MTASSPQPRRASTGRRTRWPHSGSRPPIAGVGGSLLAINVAYVSPDTFPIQLSLYLLVGAVVGFFGSIWGAVLGALLIQFLPDIVAPVPHDRRQAGGPDDVLLRRRAVVLMLLLPLVLRVAALLTNRGYSRAQ